MGRRLLDVELKATQRPALGSGDKDMRFGSPFEKLALYVAVLLSFPGFSPVAQADQATLEALLVDPTGINLGGDLGV